MQFHTYMDIIEFCYRFVSFEYKGHIAVSKMRVNAILSVSIKVHIKINLRRTEENNMKKTKCLITVFVFYFQKFVFGNIKKNQFSCIFEIKNMFN